MVLKVLKNKITNNRFLKNIEKISNTKHINLTKTFLSYETLNIFQIKPINNILSNGLTTGKMPKYNGFIMKESQRYRLFIRDEQICVHCGLKSSFWALQTRYGSKTKRPHLNLYGIDKNRNIRLFTKDHIVPKSKDGKDEMENYQIMCTKCNSEKGSKI